MRMSITRSGLAWRAAVAVLALPLGLTVAAAGQSQAATQTTAVVRQNVAAPHATTPNPATAHATTQRATTPHASTLPPGVRQVCPKPKPGQMACLALLRTNLHSATGHGLRPDLVAPEVYNPANLQSAYNLSSASASAGKGETVAVIDAYNDPHAAADLAVYRKAWNLPACDSATGAGCVTVVNEHGKARPLPVADFTGGWEVEESLDMDMVSAICPNCHILLVEATTELTTDLGTAEDTAVRLGARFISNSWGGYGVPAYNAYFNHPGVAITVASGDDAYGTSYPASSQYVTSVGGTTLIPAPATARGWRETAWSLSDAGFFSEGTGSGCSYDPQTDAKPAWQTVDDNAATGCLNRTDNDVAAVADPNSPVWFYDSDAAGGGAPGWNAVGGTSVASPIVAAVYALAGTPAARTYPASYLYQQGHAAQLYPVTSGRDGFCKPAYLCDAADDYQGTTYNGPTGWGTPNGTAAFTDTATGDTITVNDPGTQDYLAGSRLRVPVSAVDSGAGQHLSFSAAGLPAGVSVNAGTGVISGRLPARPGTSRVTISAADGTGAAGSVAFELVSLPSMRAGYHPVTGPIPVHVNYLDRDDMCLYDPGNARTTGTKVEVWKCDTRSEEKWTYLPDVNPDLAGTLVIHGRCATIDSPHSEKIVLRKCSGAQDQAWSLELSSTALYNPASGLCLNDPRASRHNGTQLDAYFCYGGNSEDFVLPAEPLLSAVGRGCMTDPGNSAAKGTAVRAEPCDGSAAQRWTIFSSWTQYQHGRLCVGSAGNPYSAPGFAPGTQLLTESCGLPNNSDYPNDFWGQLPDGQIINEESGLCLDNPGPDAKLVTEQCYGSAGEIWSEG
jgi:ricin-type beta-trefoil lectin protein/putative Ig domain-containing protein